MEESFVLGGPASKFFQKAKGSLCIIERYTHRLVSKDLYALQQSSRPYMDTTVVVLSESSFHEQLLFRISPFRAVKSNASLSQFIIKMLGKLASSVKLNKSKKKELTFTDRTEKRLQKELQNLALEPPEGIKLDEETSQGSDLSQWIIDVSGPPGTLYEGETFKLNFKFNARYPFDSPIVIFVGDSIPLHPHVYSNGHICLSILTKDWSPALSVEAVCLSILSMLASAKEKKRPPGDKSYVRTCHKNPKKTSWWYHDDTV